MSLSRLDIYGIKLLLLLVISIFVAYHIGIAIDEGLYGKAAFEFTSVLFYWLTRINYVIKSKGDKDE